MNSSSNFQYKRNSFHEKIIIIKLLSLTKRENKKKTPVKMSKLIMAIFLAVVIAQVIAEPLRRTPEVRLTHVENRLARVVFPNSARARRLTNREANLKSQIAASSTTTAAVVAPAAVVTSAALVTTAAVVTTAPTTAA